MGKRRIIKRRIPLLFSFLQGTALETIREERQVYSPSGFVTIHSAPTRDPVSAMITSS